MNRNPDVPFARHRPAGRWLLPFFFLVPIALAPVAIGSASVTSPLIKVYADVEGTRSALTDASDRVDQLVANLKTPEALQPHPAIDKMQNLSARLTADEVSVRSFDVPTAEQTVVSSADLASSDETVRRAAIHASVRNLERRSRHRDQLISARDEVARLAASCRELRDAEDAMSDVLRAFVKTGADKLIGDQAIATYIDMGPINAATERLRSLASRRASEFDGKAAAEFTNITTITINLTILLDLERKLFDADAKFFEDSIRRAEDQARQLDAVKTSVANQNARIQALQGAIAQARQQAANGTATVGQLSGQLQDARNRYNTVASQAAAASLWDNWNDKYICVDEYTGRQIARKICEDLVAAQAARRAELGRLNVFMQSLSARIGNAQRDIANANASANSNFQLVKQLIESRDRLQSQYVDGTAEIRERLKALFEDEGPRPAALLAQSEDDRDRLRLVSESTH